MGKLFGDYIRSRRLELLERDPLFTLRKVAGRIRIHPSYLSKIERGEPVSLSERKTIALARELGEDPDVLLAMTGKISEDVQRTILKRPALFTRLVRDLGDEPDGNVKADKKLRRDREELERRVRERTAELTEANERLRAEVAERKAAEEALRRSEEQYRLLAENAADVIWRTDAHYNIVYISPSVERLTGYTPAEMLTIPREQRYSTESCAEVYASMQRRLENERQGLEPEAVHTLRLYMRRKDGSFVPVEMTTRPVRDAQGRFAGVIGVSRDVSDRVHAQEALLQSEAEHRSLVESLQEGIWRIDADAVTNFVNERMAHMLGYTQQEMLGHSLYAFMDQEAAEHARELMDRRAQGFSEELDFTFLRKDGSPMHARLATAPVYDAHGRFAGAIAGVMDMTERRRTEQTQRLAMDNLPALVAYVDADMRYRFVNRRYREWFALNGMDVMGRRVSEVLEPELYATVGPRLAEALAGKEVRYSGRATYPDGVTRGFRTALVPHEDAQGQTVGVVVLVHEAGPETD